MAGRKQHYIPQCLLKGFEASRSGKKSQVIVYKRNAEPYKAAIDGVAAERDFYSEPGNGNSDTLDDVITAFEKDQFSPFLTELRAAGSGPINSEHAAKAVVHLSVRAAHLRGSFARLAQRLATRFQSLLDDTDQTRHYFGIDSVRTDSMLTREIEGTFEALGAAGVPIEERTRLERIVRFRLREKFDDVLLTESPKIRQLLAWLQKDFPELVDRAHSRALSRVLIPTQRIEALMRLRWHLVCIHEPNHFLLSDCAAISRDTSGKTQPYVMSSDKEVSLVILPISSKKVLVGSICDEVPLNLSNLNEEFARCSIEFFVSSKSGENLKKLGTLIGTTTAATIESLVEEDTPPIKATASITEQEQLVTLAEVKIVVHANIGSGDKLAGLIRRLFASEYTSKQIACIESIVVTDEIVMEVSRIRGCGLPAYEAQHVALGAVEVLPDTCPIRLRVLIPAQVARLLLLGADTPERATATYLVRHLAGRAIYVGRWVSEYAPLIKVHPFPAQERIAVDLIPRFYSHYAGAFDAGLDIGALDIHAGNKVAAEAIERAINTLNTAARLFASHGNADSLLAQAIPALDALLGAAASYCGLHLSNKTELSTSSEVAVALKGSGLWDWLQLFESDLRRHSEAENKASASLDDVLILVTHVERILWQFGIFLSETSAGQLWVEVCDEQRLKALRATLSA